MNDQVALANEQIKVPEVRLISQDGTNLGVINTREAQKKAYQDGLDLVAINTNANPIVVKIVDLGKYIYELKKDQKEKARKSREKEVVTKEIQLRPVTDLHDIEIKAKSARGFLTDGNKVRVVIKFRGRETSHTTLGFEVVNNFLASVGEYSVEKEPSLFGKSITTVIAPFVAAPTK
jgi:translation initiation factor IF-3